MTNDDDLYSVSWWKAQHDLYDKTFTDWKTEAEIAEETYLSNSKTSRRKINLLYSNVQTLMPALYNSTPKIEVDTRNKDTSDAVTTLAATILERAAANNIAEYDADEANESTALDNLLTGRGSQWIEYEVKTAKQPVIDPMTGMPAVDPVTGEPVLQEVKVSER